MRTERSRSNDTNSPLTAVAFFFYHFSVITRSLPLRLCPRFLAAAASPASASHLYEYVGRHQYLLVKDF